MAEQKRTFPDTIAIILGIMAVFVLLTWIVPAGTFERTEVDGRELIVPGSYQRVEAAPQGLFALLKAPIRGFVGAAQIIAFVFLVGGSFKILTQTGSVDAGLQSIVRFTERKPQFKRFILPLVIVLFSLAGSTFGMSEETLVFVLLTIPLALALGYDSIVGVAISFVGAGLGFAGAFINPFTIGVAQGIAELPPGSGMGYRILVWLIVTAVGVAYIMRYALRIERDPTRSPVYELDRVRHPEELQGGAKQDFTRRHVWVLLSLAAALALLVVGVSRWGWYIAEIAGLFIGLGIVAGLLGKLSLDEAIEAFKNGAAEMITAALVIGLARGLIVLAEDGRIMDTLLHAVAQASEGLPRTVTVVIMFLLQSSLNFFVPSGSGQAALTMPIMAPLSDLLGISRQTAVLAYQFGDGISNLIIPTSGVTMGVLAIARIPYTIWLRWMLPFFLLLSVLAMLLLLPPVLLFRW